MTPDLLSSFLNISVLFLTWNLDQCNRSQVRGHLVNFRESMEKGEPDSSQLQILPLWHEEAGTIYLESSPKLEHPFVLRLYKVTKWGCRMSLWLMWRSFLNLYFVQMGLFTHHKQTIVDENIEKQINSTVQRRFLNYALFQVLHSSVFYLHITGPLIKRPTFSTN